MWSLNKLIYFLQKCAMSSTSTAINAMRRQNYNRNRNEKMIDQQLCNHKLLYYICKLVSTPIFPIFVSFLYFIVLLIIVCPKSTTFSVLPLGSHGHTDRFAGKRWWSITRCVRVNQCRWRQWMVLIFIPNFTVWLGRNWYFVLSGMDLDLFLSTSTHADDCEIYK